MPKHSRALMAVMQLDRNNFYFKGQVVKKDKNIRKLLKEKQEKLSRLNK